MQAGSFKERPVNARIVVVDTIYHQVDGNEPFSTDSRFSRPLKSDEEPYQRTVKVGEDWSTLEKGWINEVGMLLLENRSKVDVEVGFHCHVKDQAKVVRLLTVPPGESCRMCCPDDVTLFKVRCQSTAEIVKCLLSLFPR